MADVSLLKRFRSARVNTFRWHKSGHRNHKGITNGCKIAHDDLLSCSRVMICEIAVHVLDSSVSHIRHDSTRCRIHIQFQKRHWA